jgi:hypothetical protein
MRGRSKARALLKPVEREGHCGRLGDTKGPSSRGAQSVPYTTSLLLPTMRRLSLPKFGRVLGYQHGTVKVGSLRMMIGSLSFTG